MVVWVNVILWYHIMKCVKCIFSKLLFSKWSIIHEQQIHSKCSPTKFLLLLGFFFSKQLCYTYKYNKETCTYLKSMIWSKVYNLAIYMCMHTHIYILMKPSPQSRDYGEIHPLPVSSAFCTSFPHLFPLPNLGPVCPSISKQPAFCYYRSVCIFLVLPKWNHIHAL